MCLANLFLYIDMAVDRYMALISVADVLRCWIFPGAPCISFSLTPAGS